MKPGQHGTRKSELPEADWVPEAVKAEDPADEAIRETSEETKVEEMTATDRAVGFLKN